MSVTSGKVLTQKTKPKLAMCIPSLSTKCGIGDGSNPSFEDFKYLTCRAPGMDDVLVIDLCDCSINHEGADMNKNNIGISSVLICNQERLTGKPTSIYTIESMDQTERFTADAGNWFSRFLGEPVRVVRRRGSPIGAKDSLTNFSNEAQFLMITEASLTKLAMV